MTSITLEGLSPAELVVYGDAALRAGDVGVARAFYKLLVNAAPRSPEAQSRYGFLLRPHSRVPAMLEALKALEAIPNSTIFVGEGIATWLKWPPFMADEKFMALATDHMGLAPSGILNWHWNLQTVLWAAQQVRAVPGDFVELGVYKGHTTLFLAQYLDFGAWPKRWWLFDTFEGVPADQNDPGRTLNAASYGEASSFEEVRARFEPFPNIEVIKGRVPEIFAERVPETIAFIHIDLNNSAAEVGALDALYDRISPGGIIVFDDFCWASSIAQATAETAWFDRRGLKVLPLPTGQGLFVKPSV